MSAGERAGVRIEDFVCPVCRGELVEQGRAPDGSGWWRCARCGRRYPVLAGGVPVLLPERARRSNREG